MQLCVFPQKDGTMTAEERAEMERLCRLIQDERDPNKFTNLVFQLNSLFKRKELRLNGDQPSDREPLGWP
jgi:hypothetical protein